jgi:hypothetical protein
MELIILHTQQHNQRLVAQANAQASLELAPGVETNKNLDLDPAGCNKRCKLGGAYWLSSRALVSTKPTKTDVIESGRGPGEFVWWWEKGMLFCPLRVADVIERGGGDQPLECRPTCPRPIGVRHHHL